MKNICNHILILFVCMVCGSFCLYGQKDQNQVDFLLAEQYMAEQKFDQAIDILESLTKKNVQYIYYRPLLNCYYQKEDYKTAEKFIKKTIKHCSDNQKILLYNVDLGLLYDKQNYLSKANKQYQKTIDLLTTNQTNINILANYFISNRLNQWAEQVYLHARELFKNSTLYTYELCYIYQNLGRNDLICKEYIILLEENPALINQIEINLNNLFTLAKDNNLRDTINEFILQKVKDFPDKEQYSQLYYWLLMQKQDYQLAFIQAKAIDKRFKKFPYWCLDFAKQTMDLKQYSFAIQTYDYILKHNKDQEILSDILQKAMHCKYNFFCQTNHHSQKEKDILDNQYKQMFSTIKMDENSYSSMQEYATFLAYYYEQPQQGADLLDSIVNLKRVSEKEKASVRLLLADIYLINNDIWGASLLYSQVEKRFASEPIGAKAKFQNAMLSYYNGDFTWAKSQFATLRASTTKLIANDAMEYYLLIKENIDPDSSYKGLIWYSKAELLIYQNKIDKALEYFDTIENYYLYHPLFDEILYKKALISLKQQDTSLAIKYFNDILIKYPEDLTADDALYNLAIIYQDQGLFDKAKQCYEQIVLQYPSSLYIDLARKQYQYYEQQNSQSRQTPHRK